MGSGGDSGGGSNMYGMTIGGDGSQYNKANKNSQDIPEAKAGQQFSQQMLMKALQEGGNSSGATGKELPTGTSYADAGSIRTPEIQSAEAGGQKPTDEENPWLSMGGGEEGSPW